MHTLLVINGLKTHINGLITGQLGFVVIALLIGVIYGYDNSIYKYIVGTDLEETY